MVGFHDHPKQPRNPNYRMWDPNYVLSVVKDRDPRIGSCADTGHWVRSNLKPVDCLRILEGRIISSHLKGSQPDGSGRLMTFLLAPGSRIFPPSWTSSSARVSPGTSQSNTSTTGKTRPRKSPSASVSFAATARPRSSPSYRAPHESWRWALPRRGPDDAANSSCHLEESAGRGGRVEHKVCGLSERLDKALLHRFDLRGELPQDVLSASRSLGGVALQPPLEPKLGRTLDEDAQRKQITEARVMPSPQALDQHTGPRLDFASGRLAAVRGKIIPRRQGRITRDQQLQYALKGRPIHGCGVVKVDAGSLGGRKLRAVAVEIIQAQPFTAGAEPFGKLGGQPRLPGAAASRQRDQVNRRPAHLLKRKLTRS